MINLEWKRTEYHELLQQCTSLRGPFFVICVEVGKHHWFDLSMTMKLGINMKEAKYC